MSLANKSVVHAHQGTAPEGIGTLEQQFDSTGSLAIIVDSIKVGEEMPLQGAAQFNMVVVPEFPLALAIAMGAALSGIIAAMRLSTLKRL
jgi:hypothetical protein